MKDIVERYNGARVSPAPKQMLADSIAEVVRLRSRIAELEADNKKLRELGWAAILGSPDELKEYLREKARAALKGVD